MELTGPSDALLLRLMSAATLRARVLAGNLANQNTPGYQRREVRFEELLAGAFGRHRPAGGIEPEVVVDRAAAPDADGNTVSPEVEVSAMRQNRLMYELYASILSARSRLVESAIDRNR